MSRTLVRLLLAGALFVLPFSGPAGAESALVLPLPDEFGEIDADTYNEAGKRIGDGNVQLVQLPGGGVRLVASSAIEGSAEMTAMAELRPTEDRQGLRLVKQTSESRDESGKALGRLLVDHDRRVGLCTPPDGGETQRIELPSPDRVVNVPHSLLFQPLVRGVTKEVAFQLLICRSGARLIEARATVVDASQGVIEVRYDMQLGPILTRLAGPFLPRLSVWFDPANQGGWLGQRFPLFAQGPTVIMVRSGFDPASLGAAR